MDYAYFGLKYFTYFTMFLFKSTKYHFPTKIPCILQQTFNILGIVGTITIASSDSNNEYTAFIVKPEPDTCLQTNKPDNTSANSESTLAHSGERLIFSFVYIPKYT